MRPVVEHGPIVRGRMGQLLVRTGSTVHLNCVQVINLYHIIKECRIFIIMITVNIIISIIIIIIMGQDRRRGSPQWGWSNTEREYSTGLIIMIMLLYLCVGTAQ